MKKMLLTCAALTITFFAGAQVHFSQTLGNNPFYSMGNSGFGSVRLESGNFVTVGVDYAQGFRLTTYNPSGTVISTSYLSNPAYHLLSVSTVAQSGPNTLLVTGMLEMGMQLYFVAKIDLVTNQVTFTTRNMMSFNYTRGPKAYTDGAGNIYALYPQYNTFDLSKLDQNLNTKWNRTITCDYGTGKSPGMDCEPVDSSIIVVGKCDSWLGWCDIDSNGVCDSIRTFMNGGYTRIYSIAQTNDGNLLVAGLYAHTYASTSSCPLVAKFNRNGHMLWCTVLNISSPGYLLSRFVDVAELPDGRIVGFATQYEAYSDTYFDGACIFSAAGTYQSAVKFADGTNHIYNFYDAKVYNNGILMSGVVTDNTSGTAINENIMVFADFDFNSVCHKSAVTMSPSPFYLGSENTMPAYTWPTTFTTSGPVPVTMGALSIGADPQSDVCYTTLGLAEEENLSAAMYPNPVESGQNLAISFSQSGNYTVLVTDISGKQVAQQNVSGPVANVSTSGLSSGAYLVSLLHNGQLIQSQKLMVK